MRASLFSCGARLLLPLLFAATSAQAEITRLEIASKQPYGSFASGDFVLWQGKVHGDLSPQEPIPGLDKAQRNGVARHAVAPGCLDQHQCQAPAQ